MTKNGQVTWLTIFGLVLIIVTAAILIYALLEPVIEVGINLSLFYFMALYIYAQVTKHKKGESYALGAAISTVIIVFLGNPVPLWTITTVAVFTIPLSELIFVLAKKKKLL